MVGRQAPEPTWLTVDELARRVGTTTRGIRAWQAAGLLPRPHVRGRTGFYDEDHLRRLRAIQRLQARGFSIAAIRALLQAWAEGRTLEDVLGLPAASGRSGDHDDDWGWLEEWPARARLALVPTPLLGERPAGAA